MGSDGIARSAIQAMVAMRLDFLARLARSLGDAQELSRPLRSSRTPEREAENRKTGEDRENPFDGRRSPESPVDPLSRRAK